jgi:peptidoglycan/xylan/chitin deacetylase (PgdA/CDA1 family)
MAALAVVLLIGGGLFVASRHTTPLAAAGSVSTPSPSADPPSGLEPGLPDFPTPGPALIRVLPVAHHGRSFQVPILVYHYIRINPVATDRVGFNLSVTPANFSAQMDYLKKVGVHTITPAQLMTALDTGAALPSHPVILTFDDGHDDFATVAEPILHTHGFVAVDYVVSGFLGRSTYMTAAQVVAMDRAGMVIGCHTVDHFALAHLSPALQRYEITRSQQQLETLLGHPVLDFAYPYGSFSATTIAILAKAGFRDAVTTVSGDTQWQDSPFTVERIHVGPAGLARVRV